MLKKLKITGTILFAAIAFMASTSSQAFEQSGRTSSNIKFLNEAEAVVVPPTGNTGPAQTEDCAGIGTGSKKICACTNQYACTESGCS